MKASRLLFQCSFLEGKLEVLGYGSCILDEHLTRLRGGTIGGLGSMAMRRLDVWCVNAAEANVAEV